MSVFNRKIDITDPPLPLDWIERRPCDTNGRRRNIWIDRWTATVCQPHVRGKAARGLGQETWGACIGYFAWVRNCRIYCCDVSKSNLLRTMYKCINIRYASNTKYGTPEGLKTICDFLYSSGIPKKLSYLSIYHRNTPNSSGHRSWTFSPRHPCTLPL